MNTRKAGRPDAAVDDQDLADYQIGVKDGRVWAHDYATPEELGGLVENFEPGRSADFDRNHSVSRFMNGKEHKDATSVPHSDSPFWRGFAAGAEEVLNELSRPS
jgi:hypothetical protein